MKERYFIRLNYSERVQHIVFLSCFAILVITGFMLKMPDAVINKLGDSGDIVFYYRGICLQKTLPLAMMVNHHPDFFSTCRIERLR